MPIDCFVHVAKSLAATDHLRLRAPTHVLAKGSVPALIGPFTTLKSIVRTQPWEERLNTLLISSTYPLSATQYRGEPYYRIMFNQERPTKDTKWRRIPGGISLGNLKVEENFLVNYCPSFAQFTYGRCDFMRLVHHFMSCDPTQCHKVLSDSIIKEAHHLMVG